MERFEGFMTGIIATVVCLMLLSLANLVGKDTATQEYREEAIKRGYAEWQVTEDGEKSFEWRSDEAQPVTE